MSAGAMRQVALQAMVAGSRAGLDPATVTDDTPLSAGGLGLSSVALLQALLHLEERLGLVFDDAAVARARFTTFGDLVAFLEASVPGDGLQAPG
jgi:acyl carrier protein